MKTALCCINYERYTGSSGQRLVKRSCLCGEVWLLLASQIKVKNKQKQWLDYLAE